MLGIMLMSLVNALVANRYNRSAAMLEGVKKRPVTVRSLAIGYLAGAFYILTRCRELSLEAKYSYGHSGRIDSLVMAGFLVFGIVVYAAYLVIVSKSYFMGTHSIVRGVVASASVALACMLLYPIADRPLLNITYLDVFMLNYRFESWEAISSILCYGYLVMRAEIMDLRLPPALPSLRLKKLLYVLSIIICGVFTISIYASTGIVYFILTLLGYIVVSVEAMGNVVAFQRDILGVT